MKDLLVGCAILLLIFLIAIPFMTWLEIVFSGGIFTVGLIGKDD